MREVPRVSSVQPEGSFVSFRRIAIVNRGESAMRLLHAVRELNAANHPDDHLQTIALHTTGEAGAMFVREADLAHDLGPASARPYVDHFLAGNSLASLEELAELMESGRHYRCVSYICLR